MRERAADVVLGMGRRREGESLSARRLAARGPEQAGQPVVEHTLHDRHRSLAERAVDDAALALAPAPQELLRRDGGEVVECARARRRRLARQVFVAVAHARSRLGAQSRVACDALAPLLAACRRIAPPLRDRDRPFHLSALLLACCTFCMKYESP